MPDIIFTVLRLADGSTVPISLRKNKSGSARLVTSDANPVRYCRRGHVIIPETIRIDTRGHTVCRICERMNHKKSYKRNPKLYNARSHRYWHKSGYGRVRREQRRSASRSAASAARA